jgi:Caspase domain
MSKRALIVGIKDYPGTINDLPTCDEDANQFENLLRTSPYGFSDVVVYRDSQATLANVVDGLKGLFKDAKPDDELVFFYSGHGFSSTKNDVLHDYLVFYDDMLSDDGLNELSQGLPDGALFTIVLDSYFAGGMEKRIFSVIGDKRTKVKAWQARQPKQALRG